MAARKSQQLGPNQMMAMKILASGPKSTRQMMHMLGMDNLRYAGQVMKRLADRKMVYICEWQNLPTGGLMAVWRTGNKQEKAKKKEERTAAQRNADYKQRIIARIGKGRWSAIRRAQESKTASVLVMDGVKIWERGKGILV